MKTVRKETFFFISHIYVLLHCFFGFGFVLVVGLFVAGEKRRERMVLVFAFIERTVAIFGVAACSWGGRSVCTSFVEIT